MAKKKKTNPRKQLVTKAYINKEVNKAKDEAILYAMSIFFFVMWDKEGWGKKRLRRVWDEVSFLSDAIAEGYVSLDDLEKTLEKEAGIVFRDN